MPWKGVTVSEQKQQFVKDFQLNYYSVTELAERTEILRKNKRKWRSWHRGEVVKERPPAAHLPALAVQGACGPLA